MRCMHAHPIPRNLLPSFLGALRPDDAAVVVDSQVIILGSARCAYAHEQRRLSHIPQHSPRCRLEGRTRAESQQVRRGGAHYPRG